MRRWLLALLALLVGVSLVVVLIYTLGFDPDRLRGVLLAPPWVLGIVAVSVVGHLGVSAIKWALVLGRMEPEQARRPWSFYLAYTGIAAVVAQVLTAHLASVVVRELSLRIEGGRPMEGAASSLVEQLFDLAALLGFATATLLAWWLGGPWLAWIGGMLAAATLLAPLAAWLLDRQADVLGEWLMRIPGRTRRLGQALAGGALRRVLSPRLALALWAWSVLRYGFIGSRAWALAQTDALQIATVDTLQAFTLVQASQLLSLTPGNLGISEWTWAGALAAAGHPTALATTFALSVRTASVLGFVVFALVAVGLHVLVRRRSRQPDSG